MGVMRTEGLGERESLCVYVRGCARGLIDLGGGALSRSLLLAELGVNVLARMGGGGMGVR